jgi:hypothetical protein
MFDDSGDHLVSVLLLNVEKEENAHLVEQAASLMKRKGDLLGFIGGEIFNSEDRTRVLIITEWSSRHDWSMSQWDSEVSENLVSIVHTASAIDSRTYYSTARISTGNSVAQE